MNSRITYLIVLVLGVFILSTSVSAQLPQYSWANTFRALPSDFSLTSSSGTEDIALDAAGNSYTIGHFYGSIDANSGSGTTTLAAEESGIRTFVMKTAPDGSLIWARCLQGEGTSNPRALAVDDQGNVYLTGVFSGTVDFNPGSGTFEFTSVSNSDMYMVKLDASGLFVWAKKINGGSFVSPNEIAIDIDGNPVFVGYFSGQCDFNPNAGTTSLTGSSNAFILKLDPAGNFVFVKHFASTSSNSILSIEIDDSGDMYLGGYYSSTTDFDPNAGLTQVGVISFSRDAFFCKLSNDGALIWVKNFGGANSDELRALALDEAGNIFVAGTFRNSVDFDPSSGSFIMQTSGSTLDDIFIAKYSPTGSFLWAKQVGSEDGNYTDENVNDLAVDPSGNVVLVGFYYDEIDFNPGVGIFSMYTGGFRNTFVLSLNSIGAFNYAFDLDMIEDVAGSESDAIQIDALGNLYIGGYTDGTCDMDPGPATSNLSSEYGQGMLWKLAAPSSTAYFTLPDYTECTGNTLQLASNNSALQSSWLWTSTGGVIADPNSPNTSITFTQSGNYNIELTVVSELGTTVTNQAVSISNGPSISITTFSPILCGGGSANMTANISSGTVQWSSGQVSPTIIVSPATTTTYTATVTASNGCTASASQVIEVVTEANITITASANSICAGESVTLTASGGTFYSWSTGSSASSITVSPTGSTTYTLNGSAGSCSGSDTQFIQVNSAPNIAIQSSGTTVCTGSSITLTATGGASYVWSTGQTTPSITVSPGSNTTYTVTGTNSSGCQNTASRVITVGTIPNVNVVASNNSPCPGTTITITAVGASTYVWASGQTTNAITDSPLVNTTYYATGTNVAGCSATDSLTIILDPLPIIQITSSGSSICAGEDVLLTASGAQNYSWSSGQTTAAINVSPLQSSSFTVTGTNSFNCQASLTETIQVAPLPNVEILSSQQAVCLGSTLELIASGAVTYTWSTGETGQSILISPTTETTYTLTGISSAGCSNHATSLIGVQEALQISFTEPPVGFCLNSSPYELSAFPAGGIFEGPGVSGDIFTPADAGDGLHWITYTLNDGVCVSDSSLELLVEPCVSTLEMTDDTNIWVFPNPAIDVLYFRDLREPSRLLIYSATGQLVAAKELNANQFTCDVSAFEPGIYFCCMINSTSHRIKKISIQ